MDLKAILYPNVLLTPSIQNDRMKVLSHVDIHPHLFKKKIDILHLIFLLTFLQIKQTFLSDRVISILFIAYQLVPAII